MFHPTKYAKIRNKFVPSFWIIRETHRVTDVVPRSTRKVFMPNPNKKRFKIKKALPVAPAFEASVVGPRVNKLDIQMLSRSLYNQIFRNEETNKTNAVLIEGCRKELHKHGMITKKEDYLPELDLKLPPLEGANIEEHFKNIGEEQLKPYRELVLELLKGVPDNPTEWVLQPGWTRYVPGRDPESVPFPSEEALIFDVEVCMSTGKSPTLASAVSPKAWYGWVSSSLIEGAVKPITSHQYNLSSLIPIESLPNDKGTKPTPYMKKSKIIIGHNVSYDRARIKEQYFLERTGTRFLDTMSLHVCVSGLTSYQRAVLKSGKDNDEDESWKNCSSLNSLGEVHKLYCGKTVDKETRSIFVEGTLSDILEDFQNVMSYCCGDVKATYNVLKVLFPMFLERFSHPVTLAGMLELSTAYLPVNNNWNRYIEDSEQAYDDLDTEGRLILVKRAEQACKLLHDEKYKEDLWLWDLDWEVKNLLIKKTPTKKTSTEIPEEAPRKSDLNDDEEEIDPLEEQFAYLEETRDLLSSVNSVLPGYPNWYRKLCTKPDSTPNWVPGPHLISTSMQITPKLLNLTWEGYPLHFVRGKGWGFLVPFTEDTKLARKLPLAKLLEKCPVLHGKPTQGPSGDAMNNINNLVQENLMKKEFYSRVKSDKTEGLYKGAGIWCDTIIEDCCYFFKLPHKNGNAYNVGNPLSKDFLNKFSENVLAGDTESAEQVLTIARKLSYWRNNRDRIFDQMLVWLGPEHLPKYLREIDNSYGAILPQVVVCGTLTRRAVEPTWMTASNAHPERIGSELRAMVQAPPGFKIVGADVDSQELWIASVIGDAHHASTHGATPLGWMTLSGTKSNGTDMHSVTAKAVGISRDHAKVINYARIYGAGQNFAERLLRQFNPTLTESEARSKAAKMFALTKGKRIFYLKKEFLLEFPDQAYSRWQAFEMAKACGKTVAEMFLKPQWVGGTESAMFNRLEAIANNPNPKTPFLGCSLSRALEPKSMHDDRYLPTRVNWVVQSGAVDFLHLMLVCMRWIMGEKVRFCLSFHDEIRFIVPEEYQYQAALAMHVTNLLTRTFCSVRLGIHDLPQSVAFFSSVEIDSVLRKESKHDCRTPSNPHGLDKGYGIPFGESLNIYESIEKACGTYSAWFERLKDKN